MNIRVCLEYSERISNIIVISFASGITSVLVEFSLVFDVTLGYRIYLYHTRSANASDVWQIGI